MLLCVCDRCGKKMNYKERSDAGASIVIYSAQAAYIGHAVDLCPDCKRLFEQYKNKMESYFMVNEDPIKIFNDEIYWDNKKKYQ